MAALWADWPVGTRVVIRYRLAEGGYSDALGDLLEADEDSALVATRRGPVRVSASDAVVGKKVPPPPPPRRRRPPPS
ncbi:putative acetyltransferase [Georgenia sunbinii]|uniref:putative acetyltransferase n=1 Tax=Georgenia sunbinii TaxID=3117728 RepID=UPI002F26ADCB